MEYYINHIIVLIGILIVIATFFLVFFSKKNDSMDDYLINSFGHDKEYLSVLKNTIAEDHKTLLNEAKMLREEIIYLKKLVEEIHSYLEKNVENNINSDDEENLTKNFKYLLNYNQFVNKNKDIIDLNKQNKSPEEIARLLNKSIREVEMVINLIR